MSIRFSVIGFRHGHIYGQIQLLVQAGAEFVSLYDPDPEIMAKHAANFPDVAQASSEEEILEDEFDSPGRQRPHPQPARPAGHPRDAAR